MVKKIKIDGKSYRMPQSFTVDQWLELQHFDFEHEASWTKILSTAIRCPMSKLVNVDQDSLRLAVVFIAHQMQTRKQINILKDFSQITFGEFVDLDVYLVKGVDKHLTQILDIFGQHPRYAAEALYIIDEYCKFRNHTYRQYAKLFDLNDQAAMEKAIGAEDGPNSIDVARAWYRIIFDLANEDLLRLDQVTEEPLKKVLNFMALKKERALEEKRELEKQRRVYDLQRNRRPH
jgi:hypothetical protein